MPANNSPGSTKSYSSSRRRTSWGSTRSKIKLGVTIAFGTDGSVPWAVHHEMEDMVRSGMTPAQVIVAATRNAADLMGVTDAGRVAPGMSADFVVLDSNPLDDITNTRTIDSVYLRGVAVDRQALGAQFSGT